MTISEPDRSSLGGWQKSYLLVSAAALIALIAVAIAGRTAIPVAIFGLIVLAGLGVFLAAPGRTRAGGATRLQPAQNGATLPDFGPGHSGMCR